MGIDFSDSSTKLLFGHEAAESEDDSRLMQYFFKHRVYESVRANNDVVLLVGFKGIGKSAVLKYSRIEDERNGVLNVWIQPDDFPALGDSSAPYLNRVKIWKEGLLSLVGEKALQRFSSNAVGKEYGATTTTLLKALQSGIKACLKNPASLDDATRKIGEAFASNQIVNVYIDDLDRGWKSSAADISNVAALFEATRDLSKQSQNKIRFFISVRTDVYYLVRTGDHSTDKVDGSVVWYSWTNNEILGLLAKRIQTFLGKTLDDQKVISLRQKEIAKYFSDVMDLNFSGRGKWENAPISNVLTSTIRKRPRDLVKLCTLAAKSAHKRNAGKILTVDWQENFEKYSLDRLQDTANEFRSELPDAERLLLGMRPTTAEKRAKKEFYFTTERLLKKIASIEEQGKFKSAMGKELDKKELAQFLYKIDFIHARKELDDGRIDRKYFEDNRFLAKTIVDFGYDWEVHMAFRWALQPDGPDWSNWDLNIEG
jgi:hypothetical protein